MSAAGLHGTTWLLCLVAMLTMPMPASAADAFPDGVAVGEVRPRTANFWTRTTVEGVHLLEIATDADFVNIVGQRPARALAANDFTITRRVRGLQPDTRYYYRWRRGADISRVGTFVTAPTPTTPADVRFTFSGDSDGTNVDSAPFFNNFEALEAARQEDGDFFLYVGDLIYSDSSLRPGGPAMTLDEYRDAYEVNRDVAALADLMADTATFAMWDDHEVQNDYDGQTVDPVRYANGRQAYFEWLPMTEDALIDDPTCAGAPLFRRFRHGTEVEVILLDERSCRSPDVEAACTDNMGVPDLAPTLPALLRIAFGFPALPPAGCLAAIDDPARTLLGPVQKARLFDVLLTSTARHKIIVSSLAIQQFYALPYDRWEGYAAERAEVLNFIRDNSIENVVFLSTDLHTNFINEVFIDLFDDPETIAHEFVTGPIATFTFKEEIEAIDPGLVALLLQGLQLVGIDCADIDTYSYGVVEADAQTGTLTVSLKDDAGNVLTDVADPLTTCTKTLGGS